MSGKAERVAGIYLASLLGMGAVAYARGRRGTELLTDSVLYGLVAGTAVNGVWFVASGEASGVVEAVKNPFGSFLERNPMGSLPKKAVLLLQSLDSDNLYAPRKNNGVSVGPIDGDPSIVTQDE